MLVAVLAIHGLLAVALWHTMRTREVTVGPDRTALLWLRPLPSPLQAPAKAAPPAAARRRPDVQRPPVVPPAPSAQTPRESTWVEAPAAPVAAAPSASAASAPPMERLLDTQATRIAIRQSARQPGLQERAARAMGEDVVRTDTELAGGVASAGKPDCARMEAPGGILGLPILAAMVASGKCTTK